MADIVLISGSPSATSKSIAVLDYIRNRLTELQHLSATFSIRDFPAEDLVLAKYDSPSFDKIKALVAGAAGIVVSTPIYKAAYSGGLKTLLDILPQTAFKNKTVLPIATGGSPSHLLAIEYALKPVLSALAATDLLQGVYLVDGQFSYTPDGKPHIHDDVRERLSASLDQLVASVKTRRAKATL